MSDIEKAEELLKRTQTFLGSHESGGGYLTPTERSVLSDIREYFNKPVVIQDFVGRDVEVYEVAGGEICFEWIRHGQPNVYFFADDLLRGLREIGVIQ